MLVVLCVDHSANIVYRPCCVMSPCMYSKIRLGRKSQHIIPSIVRRMRVLDLFQYMEVAGNAYSRNPRNIKDNSQGRRQFLSWRR